MVFRACLSWFLFLGLMGFVSVGKTAEELSTPKAKPSPKEKVEIRQDRIKSVQRKSFLKRYRLELSPMLSMSLNDAFYQKIGGGLSAAYHVADSLGIELQGVYFGTVQTDMVTHFSRANYATPNYSYLRYTAMGSILWSPIYGKLSLFTDGIMHFDAYLLGGFGIAATETGIKFASNIGLGLRYFLTSWMVVKIEVRDLIYTETLRLNNQQADYSDIQNHVMFGAGVSFFLPTEFSYDFQ